MTKKRNLVIIILCLLICTFMLNITAFADNTLENLSRVTLEARGGIAPLASTANIIDLSDSDNDLSTGASASGGKYTYDPTTKVIAIASGPVTVTGSTTERQIAVNGNCNITLDNISINGASTFSLLDGADVTLTLVGVNNLKSWGYSAGLQSQAGTTLTITAADTNQTLAAQGAPTAAGIGGPNETSGGTITIDGGTVIATGQNGGAGIGSGRRTSGAPITGGTITINGGVVEASSIGTGQIVFGSDAGTDITINGGSVKAGSLSTPPTDDSGNAVYLGTLPNQAGVTSVSVDETPFYIDGNHNGDNNLYLYMAGQDHNVDVNIGGTITWYKATWTGLGFTWDTGTTQVNPSATSVYLNLAPNPVIYGVSSVTVTATVTDSSLGTRSLNMVNFYLGTNVEPFASSPVISGSANATLDISDLNIGDYQIKAVYGGSFGGASSSDTATLHIVVNAETPNITSQPQNATYDQGSTATPLTVTANVTDSGTLSYQWYSNSVNSNTGGTAISSATAVTYAPQTNTVGTEYYYCVITNTNSSVNGTQTATATTAVATVTVNALPITHYTITLSARSGGTVTGSGSYTENDNATVTATPNTGYSFKQWTESGLPVSTNASYSFAVTCNRSLIAEFEPTQPIGTQYTITLGASGDGTVSGGGTYSENSTATVTATPNAGNSFVNWTENGVEVSTGASYSFAVIADRTLTAEFTQDSNPPQPPQPPVVVSSGRSSSSGGTSKADTAPVAGRAFTKADATKLFNEALANKPEGQTTLSFKARNFTSVDKAVLAELAALAQKNGVTLTVHFDTVAGKAVTYRISVNPAVVTTSLDLTGKIVGGKITLPKLSVAVEISVKMPAGVTIENLKITQNGKDMTATAKLWLDKNGYVHFTTTGGEIVLDQR